MPPVLGYWSRNLPADQSHAEYAVRIRHHELAPAFHTDTVWRSPLREGEALYEPKH